MKKIEQFKPTDGDTYWYNVRKISFWKLWRNDEEDIENMANGNVFRDMKEATKAKESL